MTEPTLERMNLGRRILVAAPKIDKHVAEFHRWLVEAAEAVQQKHATPMVEGERVVALVTPVGRFELAQELTRTEDTLCARIIFFRAGSALREEPQEVYSVRIYEEGAAHFGPGPDVDYFDWDHDRDRWAPRNILRIAYELAVASTAPAERAAPGGKMTP